MLIETLREVFQAPSPSTISLATNLCCHSVACILKPVQPFHSAIAAEDTDRQLAPIRTSRIETITLERAIALAAGSPRESPYNESSGEWAGAPSAICWGVDRPSMYGRLGSRPRVLHESAPAQHLPSINVVQALAPSTIYRS
jgi:hypothetical protein